MRRCGWGRVWKRIESRANRQILRVGPQDLPMARTQQTDLTEVSPRNATCGTACDLGRTKLHAHEQVNNLS